MKQMTIAPKIALQKKTIRIDLSQDAPLRLLTRLLNHEVRVRAAPPWLLRVLSFFNKDLRGFMQVVPEYVKPISFDDAKLDRLLGRMARTPYEDALRATIASIQAASA